MGIGASSINQGLKSIIIARDYLDGDGIDFTVQAIVHNETGRDAVEFLLTKTAKRATPAVADGTVLKVAGTSEPGVVAGAIAGKIREGSRVAMVGVGADAVKNMVKAYILARKYVTDDGLDLNLRPEFIEVEFEGGEKRSAVQIHVLALQI